LPEISPFTPSRLTRWAEKGASPPPDDGLLSEEVDSDDGASVEDIPEEEYVYI